jgi:hypothetical protein
VQGDLAGRVLRPAFLGSGEGARRIEPRTSKPCSAHRRRPGRLHRAGHCRPARGPGAAGRHVVARPALLRVYAADAAERWHVLPAA